MTPPCRQIGFTLLEILLALAVGGFVLAGVVQIYLSNQQSHRHQEGLARLQENGRFALTLLARNLRMAGYDDPDTAGLAPSSPPLTGADSPGGTLGGLTLAATPDRVVSEFEGGSELRDCLGRPVVANTRVSNVFAVALDGDLICNAIQYRQRGECHHERHPGDRRRGRRFAAALRRGQRRRRCGQPLRHRDRREQLVGRGQRAGGAAGQFGDRRDHPAGGQLPRLCPFLHRPQTNVCAANSTPPWSYAMFCKRPTTAPPTGARTARRPARGNGQHGAVLLVALVLLVPLTLLAVTMAQRNTQGERMSGNYRDGERALLIADSAIEQAVAVLAASGGADNGFNDELAGGGDLGLNNVSFGGGSFSVTLQDNDDGDSDPTIDSDNTVILNAVGLGDRRRPRRGRDHPSRPGAVGIRYPHPGGAEDQRQHAADRQQRQRPQQHQYRNSR